MSWSMAAAIGALPIDRVSLTVNRRTEFHQLTDAVPGLDRFYFRWEKSYDTIPLHEFVVANWLVPLVAVALYGLGIVLGTKVMAGRKAFDLNWTLATWNLSLSLFSFVGMVRTVPHVLYNLYAFSFEEVVCMPPVKMYGCGATGLWVQLFIFSKIPELFDTLFIVLRKKKLPFLHWYHHITVLLFCWHSYATESTIGLFFAAMNYSVHFVMYGYYALMAIKIKPWWFPPAIVTIGQIAQMVVGIVLTIMSGKYYASNIACEVKFDNLVAGGVMYASYLALFVQFAVDRYVLGPLTGRKTAKME